MVNSHYIANTKNTYFLTIYAFFFANITFATSWHYGKYQKGSILTVHEHILQISHFNKSTTTWHHVQLHKKATSLQHMGNRLLRSICSAAMGAKIYAKLFICTVLRWRCILSSSINYFDLLCPVRRKAQNHSSISHKYTDANIQMNCDLSSLF